MIFTVKRSSSCSKKLGWKQWYSKNNVVRSSLYC